MARLEIKYLIMIAFVFLAACIETDIYLPAFPDMMRFFSVSEGEIQGLLTWNFIGICLSGPFYGPLSDRFGRKKLLLIALGIFSLGSILTLVSSNFAEVLCGRILQGIGSGGCFTLGTAIIFDAFQKERAVEATNMLNVIVPVLMAGAPLLGGYLNHSFGFRSNFLAITLVVLLSLSLCFFFFKETLPKEKRVNLSMLGAFGNFKRVFICLPFWQVTVLVSLIFGGYIVFLAQTSILFVVEMGVSKPAFPFYQGAILAAWVVASLYLKSSMQRWGGARVKKIGTSLFVSGGVVFALATLIFPSHPLFLTAGMIPFALGGNWMMSLYFPEVMELLPDIKGVAASMVTSVRLALSSLIVGVTSVLYNGTIYPVALTVIACVICTMLLVIAYEKRKLSYS